MQKTTDTKTSEKDSMAAGLSLITVSVFLLITKNLLFTNEITEIVALLSCGFGAGVFSVGLEKLTGIKTTYIGVGAIFLSWWGVAFYYVNIIWINIIGLIIMLVGAFGVYLGLIDIIQRMNSPKNLSSKLKELILFLSSVASLVLLVLQIVFFER